MEAEAFAQIYDTYHRRVFHYLLRRLGKAQQAEELSAEVFATALKALRGGTVPRQTGSWLFGIANHLVSHFRREHRIEEAPSETLCDAGDGPEAHALAVFEARTLWACFEDLSPEHQQVLLLQVIEGRSTRETGKIMGKTEVAVRSLQFRALRTLRKRWMEEEERQ